MAYLAVPAVVDAVDSAYKNLKGYFNDKSILVSSIHCTIFTAKSVLSRYAATRLSIALRFIISTPQKMGP
jgi:hypothetical protein